MVMERNPYAPTKAALNEVPLHEPSAAPELASRSRRLPNSLLDTAGYLVVSMVIGIVGAVVNATFKSTCSDSSARFSALLCCFCTISSAKHCLDEHSANW
jgi:hypothetical protein